MKCCKVVVGQAKCLNNFRNGPMNSCCPIQQIWKNGVSEWQRVMIQFEGRIINFITVVDGTRLQSSLRNVFVKMHVDDIFVGKRCFSVSVPHKCC